MSLAFLHKSPSDLAETACPFGIEPQMLRLCRLSFRATMGRADMVVPRWSYSYDCLEEQAVPIVAISGGELSTGETRPIDAVSYTHLRAHET